MSAPEVLFLGGNGHDPVRLEPAREELARAGRPFALHELDYPTTASFDELLSRLTARAEARPAGLVYATGIGALVALCLRARGSLRSQRVLLQGGVLWGLERRWFPRVMRVPPMPALLARALEVPAIQRRFARKHFESTPGAAWARRFFAGYGDGAAFARWFRWLRPALLRRLELELAADPAALEGVEVWWGERDHVVGVEELRLTERALGHRFPLRTFPRWGHYPMIDDPRGWVAEVTRVLEAAGEPA